MIDDPVTWLRAQLDEDIAEIAKHPDDSDRIWMDDADLLATAEQGYPCAPYLQVSKKRMLAEVDAKRRILAEIVARIHPAEPAGGWEAADAETDGMASRVVRLLALPYAYRTGYREEWKP